MNRKVFFGLVREKPFDGRLAQSQVDGMNAIIDEWERRKLDDVRWLAYILGTTYLESAHSMQPIEEIGRGQKHAYGKSGFWGRGLVQITLKDNYERMGNHLNIDLVNNPDKACEMPVAIQIIFDGMIRGLFTGKKLAHYFDDEKSDWYNARDIVNTKKDRATDIMNYSRAFLFAIDQGLNYDQGGRDIDQQMDDSPLNREIGEIYREIGGSYPLLNFEELDEFNELIIS
jgi:putative chitinase